MDKIKTTVTNKSPQKKIDDPKGISHAVSTLQYYPSSGDDGNPWREAKYKKPSSDSLKKNFSKVVATCRNFYRRDPLANTTIDKLIEIGITDLIIDKGSLSDNQYRLLEGIKPQVLDFIEKGSLEFLTSGLVIPAITFGWVTKNDLETMGVKKYTKAWLPKDMWYRNPDHLELKDSLFSSEPLYFLKIPTEYINILKKLVAKDDSPERNKILNTLVTNYPEFVEKIRSGENKILLPNKNKLFIRRKPMLDNPYPTPYLYPAIEPLEHKRNIRAMDYALASRVIEAIQVFKLGDKDFPLTQETEYQLEDLKAQISQRYSLSQASIERVFQLFGNHTLDIKWVIPPVEALLDDSKYKEINNDIIYALGFPRILIMGEAERSGSSDYDFATLSAVATIENFRKKLLRIAKYIFDETVKRNSFGDYGGVRFEEINLIKFRDFSQAILDLYSRGNISRESLDNYYGYNWNEEVEKRSEEKEKLIELGLEEYNPQPFDKPNEQENITKPEENELNNEEKE